MTTNGTTVSVAVSDKRPRRALRSAMPASTGSRKTTTIQPAWATVRAKRARNNRRDGDRRGENQPQVVGQEERRQRGHDAAEREERQERQEQPRQPDADQVVAELGVLAGLQATQNEP